MLDERAILRVLTSYNRHLDDGNVGALADLFTDDGVLEAMGQRLEGREQLREFMGGAAKENTRPSTSHMLSNVLIELENRADTAAVESDFTMIARTADGAHQILVAGRYLDRLRHNPTDGWQIAERRVIGLARGSA